MLLFSRVLNGDGKKNERCSIELPDDEEWLSPILSLEEFVANNPPQADATDDDSSNAARIKIKKAS